MSLYQDVVACVQKMPKVNDFRLEDLPLPQAWKNYKKKERLTVGKKFADAVRAGKFNTYGIRMSWKDTENHQHYSKH